MAETFVSIQPRSRGGSTPTITVRRPIDEYPEGDVEAAVRDIRRERFVNGLTKR